MFCVKPDTTQKLFTSAARVWNGALALAGFMRFQNLPSSSPSSAWKPGIFKTQNHCIHLEKVYFTGADGHIVKRLWMKSLSRIFYYTAAKTADNLSSPYSTSQKQPHPLNRATIQTRLSHTKKHLKQPTVTSGLLSTRSNPNGCFVPAVQIKALNSL